MDSVLRTADDYFGNKHAGASAAIAGVMPPPPDHCTDEATAQAEVNQGRWIVRCPFHVGAISCTSAQLAHREDRRFFCPQCLNADVDGQWVKVKWPSSATKIESLLLERPVSTRQNWVPGESLQDLRDEVIAHGVDDS